MREPAQAALLYQMSTTEEDNIHKEGTMTINCQVFNFLLETYATDDDMAEDETDIMNYK